jgi:hypothetical protein
MIVGPRYNDEDPAVAAAYAQQEECPSTGLPIQTCQDSDLCYCFDFPEEG